MNKSSKESIKAMHSYSPSKKEFMDIFNKLLCQNNKWDVWADFITMFACSLSNAFDKRFYNEREELYKSIIKKYNKEQVTLFVELAGTTIIALLNNPDQDFLGDLYMQLKLGDRDKGQFFTPYHICKFMSATVINKEFVNKEIKNSGYFSVYDPTCGSGALLLTTYHEVKEILKESEFSIHDSIIIVGQDIDRIVALMCYIQISVLGINGFIKVGNSLTEPITPTDSLENYWFTPEYCLKKCEKFLKSMSELNFSVKK